MVKYNLNTFLSNIDKISNEIENKEKNEAIGSIINSLQKPMIEVLQSICEKQQKDVDELYKFLGWK